MENQNSLYGMDNEVELFLEELGLVPSTLVTPSVIKLIEHEWRMREFDMSTDERRYRDHFLQKLRKRSNIKRLRVNKPPEHTLKINF